jgi:sulfur relay (sulfurtransferase) DsrF/TusC family protein
MLIQDQEKRILEL